MNMPDIRNPIREASVVGAGVNYETYGKQTVPRGAPGYVMGRSDLMEFAACPRRWVNGGDEDRDTDATEWGVRLDAMLLSPAEFAARYVVTPAEYEDAKTGAMKPWTFAANVCKAWAEDHAGKEFIKPDYQAKLDRAAKAVRDDHEAAAILACSKTQVMVTGTYEDRETGLVIPLKGLIDILPDAESPAYGKSLADFKTCRCAAQRAYTRAVFDGGYHVQGALYLDLYTVATGEDRCEFRHVIQENVPPFQVEKRIISHEFIEAGRAIYAAALRDYAQCLSTGEWPGYDRDLIQGWGLCQPEPWMVGR